MMTRTTRGKFLQGSLGAGLALTLPDRGTRAAPFSRPLGANDDLRVAVVGLGQIGGPGVGGRGPARATSSSDEPRGPILGDPKLPGRVRETIAEMDNEVLVSVASFWEISIKVGLGKLSLPEDPDLYLPAQRIAAGVELLEIGEAEVCTMHRLPAIHRDPFDRLLVAQANCYGLVIATNDPAIRKYPVRTLW